MYIASDYCYSSYIQYHIYLSYYLSSFLLTCYLLFCTFFITLDMIEFDTEFVEEVVLSLSRLDSSSIALAAFKMHRKWILEEKIKPFNPKFGTYLTVLNLTFFYIILLCFMSFPSAL